MKKLKIIIVGIISVFLVACQHGGTVATNKVLKLVVDNASSSLNSLTTSLSDNTKILNNLGEGLVRRTLANEIEGAAASNWTISDDGLVYTFNLKATKWENGDTVTAQDFAFAFSKIATLPEAEQVNLIYYFKNGKAVSNGTETLDEYGVKALDDKTLEITLEAPTPYILQILSGYSFFPVQEKFYNSVGGDSSYGTTKETVMSNGAYTLTAYEPDTGFTLTKNATYWDSANVSVEEVNVSVVQQKETQAIMYDKGEIDMLILKDNLVDQYADSNDVQNISSDGIEYIYLSGTTGTPAPLLNNTNFKAAIAHAIDKEIIIDKILKDGSVAADYLVPTNLVLNNGEDFRAFSGKYNGLSYDVKKAQAYLAAAQAELGDIPLTFTLTFPDSATQKKVIENIKAQVETNLPGVTVVIETIPTQLFYPTLDELKTPAARSAWSPSVKDPITFLDLFRSDNFLNSGCYTNPAYDALLLESKSATVAADMTARWAVLAEAEDVILSSYAVIPLYQKGEKWLIKDNIENLTYTTGAAHYTYRFVHIS